MSEFGRLTDAVARAEQDLHANLGRQIVEAMPPIVIRHRADTSGYVAALEGGDVIDVPSRIVHPAAPAQPGRFRRALAAVAHRR